MSVWHDIWPQNKCRSLWHISWSNDFCLISWRPFDVWTSFFGIMSHYDTTFDKKNKCRSLWPICHGPVILPCMLKTLWCMNIILQDYESVTHDIWPNNKCHFELYFMVHWFCLISWKLFSGWTSCFGIISQYDPTSDLKIRVGHCDLSIFHGPLNFPYTLKTVWSMHIIFCDNESM